MKIIPNFVYPKKENFKGAKKFMKIYHILIIYIIKQILLNDIYFLFNIKT